MYYRGAQAAVLVFDVTAPATLGKAHEWVLELQAHTDVGGYGFYRSPSIGVSSGDLRNGGDGSVDTEEEPLVLVVAANKSDLKDSTAASGGVAVDMGAALRYASSIGASLHETSAVTGSGLEELFNELAKKLLQAHLERTGADAQGKDVWQRAADQAAKAGTSVGVHVGPTPPVAVGSGRRCCS
jgi:GTPase SAR1 family protein